MAFVFDKQDLNNMKYKQRKKGSRLINSEMRTIIIAKSLLANVALFSMYIYFYRTTGDIALNRTIMYVWLAIDSLIFIFGDEYLFLCTR